VEQKYLDMRGGVMLKWWKRQVVKSLCKYLYMPLERESIVESLMTHSTLEKIHCYGWATAGQRHTDPGGPRLIRMGIMRRITPLGRTVSFRWWTAHGGFGVVDQLHSYGVGLMSSESPLKIEHHYGWTWMLSWNIDDHKETGKTQCGRG
jgi:hypothetical protein